MSDYVDTRDGWREVTGPDEVDGITSIEFYDAEQDRSRYWVREFPVRPLPTAPYSVILTRGQKGYSDWVAIWYGDEWHLSANGATLTTEALLARITSFEILSEPRAVTAKAVLDRLAEITAPANILTGGAYHDVGREFGVES